MNTYLVIAIAAVQLAMIAALRNRLHELKADLEGHKMEERMRQVIGQTAVKAAAIEQVRSSWKNAA